MLFLVLHSRFLSKKNKTDNSSTNCPLDNHLKNEAYFSSVLSGRIWIGLEILTCCVNSVLWDITQVRICTIHMPTAMKQYVHMDPIFLSVKKKNTLIVSQSWKIKTHRAVPPPWSSSLLGGSTHNIPIVLRMTSAAGLTSLRADATPLRTTTNGIHKNPSCKDHALNFISSD